MPEGDVEVLKAGGTPVDKPEGNTSATAGSSEPSSTNAPESEERKPVDPLDIHFATTRQYDHTTKRPHGPDIILEGLKTPANVAGSKETPPDPTDIYSPTTRAYDSTGGRNRGPNVELPAAKPPENPKE